MGEYADEYFRNEVRSRYGFDPGEQGNSERDRPVKVQCKVCQRRVKEAGLADHMRDAHGEPKVAKS